MNTPLMRRGGIASFPELFPDEIIYSACARYKDRMKYSNEYQAAEDLFGVRWRSATVSLPCHLEHLISVLPKGHLYKVDELIDRHTILPFYSPFLPPKRVEKIRISMQGDSPTSIHNSVGTSICKIRSSAFLRFCPICASEDEKQYGTKYWHRLHQVTGVEVCPIHHVFLQESSVLMRSKTAGYTLFSAKKSIEIGTDCGLDEASSHHAFLLRIAEDVAWLLSQNNFVCEQKDIRKKYVELFENKGFSTTYWTTNHHEMIEKLVDYYSPEFLSFLNCAPDDRGSLSWLENLLPKLTNKRAVHPVYHLLIIQFLGYKAENFFEFTPKPELFEERFGRGPWRCLDITGDHFGKLAVEKIELSNRAKSANLTGIFSCACGFRYLRKGSDSLEDDSYRVDRILSVSPSWEKKLSILWMDSTLSISQISKSLGARRSLVVSQAVKLSLPFPRLGPSGNLLNLSPNYIERHEEKQKKFHQKLRQQREEWLKIRHDFPHFTRTELQRQFKNIHRWLYANDREWLNQNNPINRMARKGGTKYWEDLDNYLELEVKAEAERIRNLNGLPVRVTPHAIGMNIGYERVLRTKGHKLPKAKKVLSEIVESIEEFLIRRIEWSAISFHQEKTCPTRYKLLRRAGVLSRKVSFNALEIEEAIIAALNSFTLESH